MTRVRSTLTMNLMVMTTSITMKVTNDENDPEQSAELDPRSACAEEARTVMTRVRSTLTMNLMVLTMAKTIAMTMMMTMVPSKVQVP